MTAIFTKYIDPTNHSSARISVNSNGLKAVYKWNHSLGVVENHNAAARKFALQHGWSGHWFFGGTLNLNVYVYCDSLAFEIDPSECYNG